MPDLSNFTGRLSYGKKAEEAAYKQLKKDFDLVYKSDELPQKYYEALGFNGWNNTFDLKYGDIWVLPNKDADVKKCMKIDVKRGFNKGSLFIGNVSIHSVKSFIGDYFLFTSDLNVRKGLFVEGSLLKKAVSAKRLIVKLPSGDLGLELNLTKFRRSPYSIEYGELSSKIK